MAQSVHAAFHFSNQWPALAHAWVADSNWLVVVAAPDELALAELAARAVEEGIARTLVREPDMDNQLTAVVLEPSREARRLCAQFPLALKERGGGGRTTPYTEEVAVRHPTPSDTYAKAAMS